MAGIQFTGLASGLDTENIIKELMSAERMKVDKVIKQKIEMEYTKEVWEDMNAKIYEFYTKQAFALKSSSTYLQKKAFSSDDSIVSVNTSTSSVNGTHTVVVNQLAKGSYLTGAQLTQDRNSVDITAATTAEELVDFGGNTTLTIQVSIDNGTNYTDIEIDKKDTISTITSKINAGADGINVSYDSNFNRIFTSTTDTGFGKQIKLAGDDALLTALGFTAGNRDGTVGQNAKVTYNGTDLESTDNEVDVNGMILTLKSEGQTANITISQDTEAIYNKIKDFVKAYNELIDEINTKLDADYNKDYEPLTDEEKQAMDDDTIKQWETKIKDSLLRRDDVLTSINSSMRNILTLSSGVDTSQLSSGYQYLSDLGIVTGLWTENGKLHIEGDEEEVLYGLKENKLKTAIEDEPEKVAELFTAIGNKLYSDLQDKMKSTELSSALTFFNDKQMDDKINDYTLEIEDLEERLITIEERYYSQFTAMEKMIQQMNSQSSWIASQLGGM